MDANSTSKAAFGKELAGADRAYIALPPAATSTTTQWHDKSEVEALWMLCGAYLLFFGQAGFVLLEAGHVRASLARQVAVKVLLQVCIVAITWWGLGYPFAFGEGGPLRNAFIGGKDWFLPNSSTQPNPNQQPELFPLWMLHFAYCAMAVAVASCALAERGRLVAHVLLAVVMSCWIYPVVVHWVWSTEGWLSARHSYGGPVLGGNGFIDCAGSAVVHITAGATGLAGAWLVGPRQCVLAYSSSGAASGSSGGSGSSGSSLLLSALGGLFIWLSWYGLAPGNVVLTVSSVLVAARVSVAVTLAASAGCLGVFSLQQLLGAGLNLRAALDGALAGLVAISASCAVVEMYAAFVIGLLGGGSYLAGLWLLRLLQVDDPVHVAAVHLLPGIWGAIAPGIFAAPALLPAVGYAAPAGSGGIFYKGDGKQLGIQLLGALVVFLWSLGLSLALFMLLKALKLLRVPAASEGIGWLSHGDVDSADAAQSSPSLSGLRRQPRQSSKSCMGTIRAHSTTAQHQLQLRQQSRTHALCADEQCIGDLPHLMADTETSVVMPSFASMNADWSHHASRACSAAGGGAAAAGAAENHSYHGTSSAASSRQGLAPGAVAAAQMSMAAAAAASQGLYGPMQMNAVAAQQAAALSNANGGAPRPSWSDSGNIAARAAALESLRMVGSSSNLADTPLCMMPTSTLPAGLQPCPYIPPQTHSSAATGLGARAAGGTSSLRSHSVSAVPPGPGRFWSTGGGSPSPDLSQLATRAGSMLVLAPGAGGNSSSNSSSIYGHPGVLPARLQQDSWLLQQQAQRAQSVSVGVVQRQAQQQQQQAAHVGRMPGGLAAVSRTGSAISSSGRAMQQQQQCEHHGGGYSSSNASRSSSPAELSSSLDLRRRSLVAASAASLEGRRPGSPLGQTGSLSAAGSAALGGFTGSGMGGGGAGDSSSRPASPREAGGYTAAGAAGQAAVAPVPTRLPAAAAAGVAGQLASQGDAAAAAGPHLTRGPEAVAEVAFYDEAQ